MRQAPARPKPSGGLSQVVLNGFVPHSTSNGRPPAGKPELVPSLSLLARIVSRVDVVDASRPGELNLHDCPLVPGPTKMRMLCRYYVQRAHTGHLATLVQLFAHAETDATAEHRDYLCIRMSVWRNLVVGRKFDALDDHLGFRRGPHQNGGL